MTYQLLVWRQRGTIGIRDNREPWAKKGLLRVPKKGGGGVPPPRAPPDFGLLRVLEGRARGVLFIVTILAFEPGLFRVIYQKIFKKYSKNDFPKKNIGRNLEILKIEKNEK